MVSCACFPCFIRFLDQAILCLAGFGLCFIMCFYFMVIKDPLPTNLEDEDDKKSNDDLPVIEVENISPDLDFSGIKSHNRSSFAEEHGIIITSALN